MKTSKDFEEEYKAMLEEALDEVEKGYITEERMSLIRHACNYRKPIKIENPK